MKSKEQPGPLSTAEHPHTGDGSPEGEERGKGQKAAVNTQGMETSTE